MIQNLVSYAYLQGIRQESVHQELDEKIVLDFFIVSLIHTGERTFWVVKLCARVSSYQRDMYDTWKWHEELMKNLRVSEAKYSMDKASLLTDL